MLNDLISLLITPVAALGWSLVNIQKILTGGYLLWELYILLFFFLLPAFPFVLKRYFKKINFLLLPLLVFLAIQIIPLPRSPYWAGGGELSASSRDEPYAIGIGYPFAFVKYFLGNGCLAQNLLENGCSTYPHLESQFYTRITPSQQKKGETGDVIHSGDIVFLPESSPLMIGFLIYDYLIFFIILGIKEFIRRSKKKS